MGERAAAAVLCVLAFVLWAPAAHAARPALETILQDDAELLHGSPDEVRAALAQIRDLGADRVRITAGWSVLTRDPDRPQRPVFDATDPAAYEQARWAALDQAVALANEMGLKVMIDVGFWAPAWAARDAEAGRARTDIDAGAFAAFAVAVARRYSGSFTPPPATGPVPPPPRDGNWLLDLLLPPPRREVPPPVVPPGPLPRVDMLTLWNEPNHPAFMRPQWSAPNIAASPHQYRRMVEAAYPAVKAARPDVKVLVGATAAVGDNSGRGVEATGSLSWSSGWASGTVRSEYGWCDQPSPGSVVKPAQSPSERGRMNASTQASSRRKRSGATAPSPSCMPPLLDVLPTRIVASGRAPFAAG